MVPGQQQNPHRLRTTCIRTQSDTRCQPYANLLADPYPYGDSYFLAHVYIDSDPDTVGHSHCHALSIAHGHLYALPLTFSNAHAHRHFFSQPHPHPHGYLFTHSDSHTFQYTATNADQFPNTHGNPDRYT